MKASRAQIVATIGPASTDYAILKEMVAHQMDVARLNFSWASLPEHKKKIELIRKVESESGRPIPIIQDLPGPRVQEAHGHTFNVSAVSAVTSHDKELIRFGVEQNVDYIAVSFVGSAQDIKDCKKEILICGGKQKVIAKIERKEALHNLDEIIEAADAIMVARGDLGDNIPLEKVPFVEEDIIRKSKKAGKPVITATEMMLTMVEKDRPSRAEVTDVSRAILVGSDAVMLSEESASGKHPVEAVAMMERVVIEAEKHMEGKAEINLLTRLS